MGRSAYEGVSDGQWAVFAQKVVEERDEARAEVERLNKRLEGEQHFIDEVCHYRNLAIVLGAKPNQMLGKFDRDLCESGIDPDETSGGYHVSVNQQLEELNDVWAEVERLRDIVEVNDERLATLNDEKNKEIKRLRDLIDTVMRNCMECYDKKECQSCAWLREGTEGK